ncbi:mCG8926, partial [Mus musculus]
DCPGTEHKNGTQEHGEKPFNLNFSVLSYRSKTALLYRVLHPIMFMFYYDLSSRKPASCQLEHL